jgi:hypothetical protein
MRTATRRRRGWAIAASIGVHLAAGLALLWQRPETVASDPIVSVLLVTRPPPARGADAPRPTASPARHPQGAAVAPLAAARTPGPPAEGSPGAGVAAAGPPAPDLRLALRHGVAGCANLAGHMSRAERERCDDQLAQGAAQAKPLGLALEPRILAYYDAVARAKTPDGPLTPMGIKSDRLGVFAVDRRGVTGHPPMIGCRIPFGPGKPRKLPSHWLKLGPCFIAPPQGPLSVEADITPPDQDMNPR